MTGFPAKKMFLDASALVAIIAQEADADELSAKLKAHGNRQTSPIAIYEAVTALVRIRQLEVSEVENILADFLEGHGVKQLEISAVVGTAALKAFAEFGKGRHRASLNMGDCFTYACAKVHKIPILCKGEDFGLTDIKVA